MIALSVSVTARATKISFKRRRWFNLKPGRTSAGSVQNMVARVSVVRDRAADNHNRDRRETRGGRIAF
jgi:hypothetical protein